MTNAFKTPTSGEEEDKLISLRPKNNGESSLEDVLVEIQKSLGTLEMNYIKLSEDWRLLSTYIKESIKELETSHKLVQDEFFRTNRATHKVMSLQERALKAYRVARIRERIAGLVRPHLGNLYQYEPKPMLPAFNKPRHALKKTPTISIVTPSFNQGRFLERTIRSVIDQNYPALEYIIQDGGSHDNSVEIIKRYSDYLKHWGSASDQGQSHALNLGFRQTTGEIMAYLNSDDVLMPGTLSYVADYFNRHPKVDVIYSHRVIINEDDYEVGRWILPKHNSQVLKWADFIPQETLFWRRSLWEKVGGRIDEDFKFAMDWDLLLRFTQVKANFKRVPCFLGAFRVHPFQKTSESIAKIGLKEMDILRTRTLGRTVEHGEIKRKIAFYVLRHVILHKMYKAGIVKY